MFGVRFEVYRKWIILPLSPVCVRGRAGLSSLGVGTSTQWRMGCMKLVWKFLYGSWLCLQCKPPLTENAVNFIPGGEGVGESRNVAIKMNIYLVSSSLTRLPAWLRVL